MVAAKVSMSDHFALFGFAPAFALDEKALQQKYLALQREFHPDRAVPENKLAMLQKSADINEAYRVLKNPVERAEYLLGDTKDVQTVLRFKYLTKFAEELRVKALELV